MLHLRFKDSKHASWEVQLAFCTHSLVQIRSPGSDFRPFDEMLEWRPIYTTRLFQSPLARLLIVAVSCLNVVNTLLKITDLQNSIVSTYLSKLDNMMPNLAIEQMQQQPMDFAIATHEFLSDLTSHVTQLRKNNMFKDLPNIESPSTTVRCLLDSKEIVDHIKLQRRLINATIGKCNSNSARPKRYQYLMLDTYRINPDQILLKS